MTVKLMMIKGRLPKTIVPTSKMFNVSPLELGKFLACVLVVNIQHENSKKEIMTFATLDSCNQENFITSNLMKQLYISGIKTFINIKTLIGHQKQSSYLVELFSVSKATVSDGHQIWKQWKSYQDKMMDHIVSEQHKVGV